MMVGLPPPKPLNDAQIRALRHLIVRNRTFMDRMVEVGAGTASNLRSLLRLIRDQVREVSILSEMFEKHGASLGWDTTKANDSEMLLVSLCHTVAQLAEKHFIENGIPLDGPTLDIGVSKEK